MGEVFSITNLIGRAVTDWLRTLEIIFDPSPTDDVACWAEPGVDVPAPRRDYSPILHGLREKDLGLAGDNQVARRDDTERARDVSYRGSRRRPIPRTRSCRHTHRGRA